MWKPVEIVLKVGETRKSLNNNGKDTEKRRGWRYWMRRRYCKSQIKGGQEEVQASGWQRNWPEQEERQFLILIDGHKERTGAFVDRFI